MKKLFKTIVTATKAPLAGFLMSSVSTLALAGGGAEQEHGKSGLPQLDTSTFSSQIFWLLLVFSISYYAFSKKILPKIEKVLDHRAKIIGDDLAKAEKLSRQASEAKHQFEETLRKARAEAKHLIETAQAESTHTIGQKIIEADQLLHDRLEQTDQKIQAEKKRALTEFNALVVTVVQDAVQKIIGLDLPEKKIVALLDQALQQRERGRA